MVKESVFRKAVPKCFCFSKENTKISYVVESRLYRYVIRFEGSRETYALSSITHRQEVLYIVSCGTLPASIESYHRLQSRILYYRDSFHRDSTVC